MNYKALLEHKDVVKSEIEKAKEFIAAVEPEVTDLLGILGVVVMEVQARMMAHLMEKYQMTQDDAREMVMNSISAMQRAVLKK